MKTFVIATAIFLTILAFVITSTTLLVKFANELKDLADEFPSALPQSEKSFQTALDDFNEYFNKRRLFIHFIVGHSENQAIENALSELEARQKSGDPAGYASARSRLISAIDKIINSESLSLNTVF